MTPPSVIFASTLLDFEDTIGHQQRSKKCVNAFLSLFYGVGVKINIVAP